MKSLLLALVMVASASTAFAQVEERVSPPQDATKSYLTVFGQETEPRYLAVVTWMNRDLKGLRDQFHFSAIKEGHPMFTQRYGSTVKSLPCVRLQTPDGQVIYQASGDNIPGSPNALKAAIENAQRNCPWRPSPNPDPAPTPDPEPQPVEPQPEPTPDTVEPAPAAPDFSVWVVLGLVAAGAGLGLVSWWRDTYFSK
jgi:hypothetical protein